MWASQQHHIVNKKKCFVFLFHYYGYTLMQIHTYVQYNRLLHVSMFSCFVYYYKLSSAICFVLFMGFCYYYYYYFFNAFNSQDWFILWLLWEHKVFDKFNINILCLLSIHIVCECCC